MTVDDRAAIRRMLEAHNTLTLATSAGGRAWAATVFYASDRDFNLYFVSDRRTRHAQEMNANPEVALAINADVDNWNEVRGLQMAGRASLAEGVERATALALYLGKFASVKALFDAPRSADEETIARRLKNTAFWRVTPRFIRLIDNARGFGFKIEIEMGDGSP
ncbi:MAG: pyridoxamine 5'-phosphate oxidase family protein [Gammaproteobacteria bacterium]|nr:pyridoxamine 5'-phosphate oxidase family protein [Gammaproteobacteria bacterium]